MFFPSSVQQKVAGRGCQLIVVYLCRRICVQRAITLNPPGTTEVSKLCVYCRQVHCKTHLARRKSVFFHFLRFLFRLADGRPHHRTFRRGLAKWRSAADLWCSVWKHRCSPESSYRSCEDVVESPVVVILKQSLARLAAVRVCVSAQPPDQ